MKAFIVRTLLIIFCLLIMIQLWIFQQPDLLAYTSCRKQHVYALDLFVRLQADSA